MISLFLEGFAIAVIAYVYAVILTDGGMILNFWYNWIDKHLRHKQWLFKPLIGCYKCVAGQMAFWYYLITFSHYNLFHHLFITCLSIYTSIILNTWKNRN